MGDTGKLSRSGSIVADLKTLVPVMTTRRKTKAFAYGFVLTFVACTAFLAFSPSGSASSPWFNSLFSSSPSTSISPYQSHFNSIVSYFFPNSSASSTPQIQPEVRDGSEGRVGKPFGVQQDGFLDGERDVSGKNQTGDGDPVRQKAGKGGGDKKDEVFVGKNETRSGDSPAEVAVPAKNQTLGSGVPVVASKGNGVPSDNQKNQTALGAKQSGSQAPSEQKPFSRRDQLSNFTGNGSVAAPASKGKDGKREDLIDKMMSCDIFHGNWVRDDSYPLYPEGSCPHIDEPFDCYHNGRPDRAYQKLRWQPTGCNIPRLNATDMLERLRGKRLVFVGDSLNRNMWESLVCVLRNAVKDRKKVFEASGKHQFRTEGSYSFLFKDYGCTVEFFRSPFLVQEWELDGSNGTKKETLRLDIVERSALKYKDAYVIVFNTGHWWTHEKTSKGKDYYQEGNHVYSELNVADAFHKALNTWAKWVDTNVNSERTHVFFRGYSASHFSGGQWNSGGQCDKETEPIKNEAYLSSYPPKMSILESVIDGMKTPVTYLNITRMTDYRKDAHPSIFRKPNMTEEEKAPDQIQDCSHWCLPGVPDSWNELLYAQLLIKQHQKHH